MSRIAKKGFLPFNSDGWPKKKPDKNDLDYERALKELDSEFPGLSNGFPVRWAPKSNYQKSGRIPQPEFQLKTGTPDVWLSTVSLPFEHPGGSYETCVFYKDRHSDVLERYQTRADAQKGHVRHAAELGLIQEVVIAKEENFKDEMAAKKRRIKFDE